MGMERDVLGSLQPRPYSAEAPDGRRRQPTGGAMAPPEGKGCASGVGR